MDDPWQFLILDRNTATERDVKAAYARLLKQHRPDQDPEGFQKLRAAYEAALAGVEQRAAGSAPPPAYATPSGDAPERSKVELPRPPVQTPLPFCEESLADEVRQALGNLEHAVATRNTEQMQAAGAHFLAAFRKAQLPASNLIDALHSAFDADAKLTARGITEETLVYLAEHGHADFCHGVVALWEQSEERGRFWNLGNALLKRREPLATPEGAALMARVGLWSALDFPDLATSLANASFPNLSVEGRQHLVSQIEHGAALGKLFTQVEVGARSFWFRQLRNDSPPVVWSSPEARRSVDTLVQVCRFPWGGWGIIKQLMPAEEWTAVEQRLREQARQVQSGGQPQRGKFLLIPGVFVVIALIRFVVAVAGDGGGATSHHESRPSSTPVFTDDYWTKQRELQEKLNQIKKTNQIVIPSSETKEYQEAMQRLAERDKKAAEEEARRAQAKSKSGPTTVPNFQVPAVGQPAAPSSGPLDTSGSATMKEIMGGAHSSKVIIPLPNGQKVEVANPQPAPR